MKVPEAKYKITIDTNCINIKPNENLDKIFCWHEEGKIDVHVPDGVIREILKEKFDWFNNDNLLNTPAGQAVEQRLDKIEKCSVIRGPLICGDKVYGNVGGTSGGEVTEAYERKIESIIDSEYDYQDIRILLLHISAKNDFFITRNVRHFINGGRREAFLNEFKIHIKTPDEFINYFEKCS
jgi:hypothetical protein